MTFTCPYCDYEQQISPNPNALGDGRYFINRCDNCGEEVVLTTHVTYSAEKKEDRISSELTDARNTRDRIKERLQEYLDELERQRAWSGRYSEHQRKRMDFLTTRIPSFKSYLNREECRVKRLESGELDSW